MGLGPGDTPVSAADVVPALMELTVHREAETDAGRTFTKLVSLLFGAPPSPLSVSAFTTLSSALLLLQQTAPTGPTPRASFSISLHELILTGIPVGAACLRFLATDGSLVCSPLV